LEFVNLYDWNCKLNGNKLKHTPQHSNSERGNGCQRVLESASCMFAVVTDHIWSWGSGGVKQRHTRRRRFSDTRAGERKLVSRVMQRTKTRAITNQLIPRGSIISKFMSKIIFEYESYFGRNVILKPHYPYNRR
jgi:hypothetical protein